MKRPALRLVFKSSLLSSDNQEREVISISSTIIRRSVRQPKLDAGAYDAVIESVVPVDGVETRFGVRDQIVVTFDVDGTSVKKRYNKSLHPKSALYELIFELGGDVGKEFDVAELEGKQCRVTIIHRMTDTGDVWENVDRVMKPSQTSTLE
jgi:hypothetical protein